MGVAVLAVATLGLSGCEKDEGPSNHAPEIVSISALEGTTITQNQSVTLVAVVTDEDGDTVNFVWSAPSGSLNATDNDTVVWTSTETEGIVTISLRVDDDENVASGSTDVPSAYMLEEGGF